MSAGAMLLGLAETGARAAESSQTVPAVLVAEHRLDGSRFTLTRVDLRDRTDMHDQPVQVATQPLAAGQALRLTGNLFVVEDAAARRGWIFARRSPVPQSRPLAPDVDLLLGPQADHVAVKLFRAAYEPADNLWQVLTYEGGVLERTRALQRWQRSLRPDSPWHRVPRFVTNTWGDRSRDSRINEAFVLKEIAAAREIGADIVQIDDGWQQGLSGNSAFQGKEKTKGLTGFWGVSDSFWKVNKERFPNGLSPVLDKARQAGVEIGLWYAPDSDDDLANWEKDANTILSFYQEHRIRFVKIDGLDVVSPLAQERVAKLLATVQQKSNGEIMLLLDITGNHKRAGFLGAIPYGPLYVENRYTDWGNYWPHRTLRNLWNLAHWIDPARLHFEFLNNTRNGTKYRQDPLAPGNYPPDYLFASVMMSNPLGFFEASNLPADFVKRVASVVEVWRQHRQEIFAATICPIGQEPSGHSWTGFMTANEGNDTWYLLCFREFTDEERHTFELPLDVPARHRITLLHGAGSATADGNRLAVAIKQRPGYLFLKIEAGRGND